MAWFCCDCSGDNGGGGPGTDTWLPWWYIIDGQTVTVPTRKEYALHGELLLEGDLILDGSSRLILEL